MLDTRVQYIHTSTNYISYEVFYKRKMRFCLKVIHIMNVYYFLKSKKILYSSKRIACVQESNRTEFYPGTPNESTRTCMKKFNFVDLRVPEFQ